MGLKKLAYILFIFLISVLHTLTLTTWLDKDSGITEANEDVSFRNSTDSLVTSKRSISAFDVELNRLNR